MNVLVTGASGVIGSAILDHLSDKQAYSFTCLDTEPIPNRDTIVADVTDYDAIRPAFEGQEAVVHLALVPGTGTQELGWSESLEANLKGINNVYEAAVEADLNTLLFASSNHAVGLVEVRNSPSIYYPDSDVTADETEPHRPDSLYGLTKSYGEDLGRLAAETHGLRFYGLRIGACRDLEYDHPYGDAERRVEEGTIKHGNDEYNEQVARMKGLWQSRRDLAHLVDCCLQDETVEWDHFYGVSANDRRWLDDLQHAHDTIGYEPQDNGEEWNSPSA